MLVSRISCSFPCGQGRHMNSSGIPANASPCVWRGERARERVRGFCCRNIHRSTDRCKHTVEKYICTAPFNLSAMVMEQLSCSPWPSAFRELVQKYGAETWGAEILFSHNLFCHFLHYSFTLIVYSNLVQVQVARTTTLLYNISACDLLNLCVQSRPNTVRQVGLSAHSSINENEFRDA